MRLDVVRNTITAFLCTTLVIILINILVPLPPALPAAGLDPSWVLGLSYAVAHHLQFGTAIIFTYGPYAQVLTHLYNSTTVSLVIGASIYLAACYAAAFSAVCLWSRKRVPIFALAFLCVVLALFPKSKDAIFYLYPIICTVFTVAFINSENLHHQPTKNVSLFSTLFIILIFSSLGLISLIKSSFIFPCIFASLVSCALFLSKRKYTYAALPILVPLASTIIFWTFSGQELWSLPSFLNHSIPIITGYTPAMSLPGRTSDFLPFFIEVISVLVAIALTSVQRSSKAALFIFSFLIIYLAFKEGFVRHDGHALIAAYALLLLIGALGLIGHRRATLLPMIATLLCAGIIGSGYRVSFKPATLASRVVDVFTPVYRVVSSKIEKQDHEKKNFRLAIANIGASHPLPSLKGRSDIYPWEVSTLIASGNNWDPRPIFQSYSAYTPTLALLNAQHLEGNGAPDNIFFSVRTIDNRFPAFEDGASWLALLRNYWPRLATSGYLILKRRESMVGKDAYALKTDLRGRARLGEIVHLPSTAGKPLFAEIDVRRTLAGRVISLLYKPPRLRITLWDRDGSKVRYRFISGMARTPFLLSPLVRNTSQFSLLYGRAALSAGRSVKAFRIAVIGSPKLAWQRSYSFRLLSTAYPRIPDTSLPHFANPQQPELGLSAVHPYKSRIPSPTSNVQCSLDSINGKPSARAASVSTDGSVTFGGWMGNGDAKAVDEGVLILKGTKQSYSATFATGVARPDVAKALHSKAMERSGYNLTAALHDVAPGTYKLFAADPADPSSLCNLHRMLTVR